LKESAILCREVDGRTWGSKVLLGSKDKSDFSFLIVNKVNIYHTGWLYGTYCSECDGSKRSNVRDLDVKASNCILRNEASLCTCVQQKNH
uniref:SH3 domain-containing protein n=1 Tax=Haemonchus placei TaxID=6290 RepID=A0A0N4WIK5_HAEPC